MIKSLKKYFKVIICFMAFAILSMAFAFGPVLSSYAALDYTTANYNVLINSVKMPRTTVDVAQGQKLKIPKLSSNMEDANYKIRVIDPAGTVFDYTIGDQTTNPEAASYNGDYFDDTETGYVKVKALNNGPYDIVYIMKIGAKTYYSNKYTVQIKNVAYALNFTDNDGLNFLIPSNLKAESDRIELPKANVATVDGDAIPETIAPKVTKDGGLLTLDDNGSGDSDFIFEDGKYYLNPSEVATYKVEYTYSKGSNPPTKTFTINVTKDFENPTQQNFSITEPTMPKVELGDKDIKLPKLTVGYGNNENIDYNVTSIVITKTNDNTVSTTLTNNTFTFDMTKELFGQDNYKDMVGSYFVKYNIMDAYGNTKTITYTINDIKDNTKPSVYLAYSYEIDTDTGLPVTKSVYDESKKANVDVDDVNTNYAIDLKAKYGYSEIILPAIYATDKTSDYTEFKFVRYIQNKNDKTIYYVDNVKYVDGELVNVNPGETGYNYSGDSNIGDPSKVVKFQFSEDGDDTSYKGEYELGYFVAADTITEQSNYVYSSGTTRYSITVLTNSTHSEVYVPTTPTIEISNLKNGVDLSSDATTKVYYSSTDGDDGKIDARLKNSMFYFYDTALGTDFETDLRDAFDYVLSLDGTVEVDTEYPISDTYLNKSNILDDPFLVDFMISKGYTGFTVLDVNASNEYCFDLKFVDYETTFGSSAVVVAVTMNDEMNVGVDSRVIKLKDMTDSAAPIRSIVSGGSLVTSGSFATVKTFNQADDVVLPTIMFSDTDSSLELSVVYYIDSPESNSGLEYLATINPNYKNNTITGGKIITSEVGTYYIIYTATDDAGNTTAMFFSFLVEDSSDPILSINATGEGVTKSGNTVTGSIGSVISFDPTVFLSNGKTNVTEVANIDYTVDTGDQALTWSTTSDYMTFKFSSVGDYTLTFTATYDGKTAMEKVINVAITLPDLEWDGEISVYPTAKMNETVILPDWAAYQADLKATVTVTVTAPDGGAPVNGDAVSYVDGESKLWKFTTTDNVKGTYKVTYTAKTKYSTITKTFEIKVGDSQKPIFEMNYEDKLEADIVYDGNQIEYNIEVKKSGTRTMIITVKSAGKTIYSYDTGLTIKDRDDSSSPTVISSWSGLVVTLKGDNNIVTESDTASIYYITGTGKCTLTLTITDNYDNTAIKEIVFNVVKKDTSDKKLDDTAIGAILIGVSLTILGLAIAYFLFSGKKGGNKTRKIKSDKNTTENDKKDNKKVDKVDSDAKTGEIE